MQLPPAKDLRDLWLAILCTYKLGDKTTCIEIKLVSVCCKDLSIQFPQYPLPSGNSEDKFFFIAMRPRYCHRLPCVLSFLVLLHFTLSRSLQVRFSFWQVQLGNFHLCNNEKDLDPGSGYAKPSLEFPSVTPKIMPCTHLQRIISLLLCFGLQLKARLWVKQKLPLV